MKFAYSSTIYLQTIPYNGSFLVSIHLHAVLFDKMGGKKKSKKHLTSDESGNDSEEDYVVEKVVKKRITRGKVYHVHFDIFHNNYP